VEKKVLGSCAASDIPTISSRGGPGENLAERDLGNKEKLWPTPRSNDFCGDRSEDPFPPQGVIGESLLNFLQQGQEKKTEERNHREGMISLKRKRVDIIEPCSFSSEGCNHPKAKGWEKRDRNFVKKKKVLISDCGIREFSQGKGNTGTEKAGEAKVKAYEKKKGFR